MTTPSMKVTLQDLVNSLASLAQCGGACEIDVADDPCARCDDADLGDYCSCCDPWLSAAADQAQEDKAMGPHPYTVELAQRVRGMLGQQAVLPGVTLLADAIEEAFWFAARDLRAGREVHLHHIGDLLISDEGHGPDLGVMPDRDLLGRFGRLDGLGL